MKIFSIKLTLMAMLGVSMVGCAGNPPNTPNFAIQNNPVVSNPVGLVMTDDNPTQNQMHDHNHDTHSHEIPRAVGTKADFDKWLIENPWQTPRVSDYQAFLNQQLGKNAAPPLHQLLTTARSWQECGFEPYQVPPEYLWHNMLPTLKLYAKLKQLGILPPNTEIRSVYRNPELNRCAGGAAGSKHLTNGAVDIWVPTYDKDSWQMKDLQNRLCQFWIDNGSSHSFGLGIYATGAIHLDTQGYRKWGGEYSEMGSPCRYILPKPDEGYTNFSIIQTPIQHSNHP